eukprot:TRINITY_DN22429_c0_g1_i2.p1 TRINITY_DN22429_c0_g1~~TRINITY_DN22429_c0_g1_i2.p1  ORF type:complete len:180 (+),score=5.42 TRINITY_DN22429_c0_g1_i2:187-726(+)
MAGLVADNAVLRSLAVRLLANSGSISSSMGTPARQVVHTSLSCSSTHRTLTRAATNLQRTHFPRCSTSPCLLRPRAWSRRTSLVRRPWLVHQFAGFTVITKWWTASRVCARHEGSKGARKTASWTFLRAPIRLAALNHCNFTSVCTDTFRIHTRGGEYREPPIILSPCTVAVDAYMSCA